MSDSVTAKLRFGLLFGAAVSLARRRWATLHVLMLFLDWGPHLVLELAGVRGYDPSQHNAAAFAQYALQAGVLAFCGLLMQTSAMAVGLGGSGEPVSVRRALGRVLGRLPALAPWWLAIAVPTAATLWVRWASSSDSAVYAVSTWRIVGSSVFVIGLGCAIGVFPLVVLAEKLSGYQALVRCLRLMDGRRGDVFVVVFFANITGLLINLTTPYATLAAARVGLGRVGILAAYFLMQFGWEAVAVVFNLAYVELYRELVRAHDGVAPEDVAHVFA